jgi:hypothetical protein
VYHFIDGLLTLVGVGVLKIEDVGLLDFSHLLLGFEQFCNFVRIVDDEGGVEQDASHEPHLYVDTYVEPREGEFTDIGWITEGYELCLLIGVGDEYGFLIIFGVPERFKYFGTNYSEILLTHPGG